MGGFAPSIYGGNFADFAAFSAAPAIGAVQAGEAWPSAR